jgi:mono/diheme cytochrome c family protein
MASRSGAFLLGIIVGIFALVAGAIVFVKSGGISMKTSAAPLPFEEKLAGMAVRASIGDAANQKNPLPPDATNLSAGAQIFEEHCSGCHGVLGQPRSAFVKGMFPSPPQLLTTDEAVTDDPEGATYWVVTHGIRLSGMPAFDAMLSDTERWQVTALVAHAGKLPPAVSAILSK